jgi:hypothetical protein
MMRKRKDQFNSVRLSRSRAAGPVIFPQEWSLLLRIMF